MKKHLSLILRILLAAAGVAYIAWHIDWTDKVEVRAGATMPGGTPLSHTAVLRVLGGDVDPRGQRDTLLVDVTPLSTPLSDWAIPPEAFVRDSEHFLLRPSFGTTLEHANAWLLLLGLLVVGPIFPVQAYRWLVLMRARGLDVSYAKALELTMVGSFFNFCMPGSTGGDVIKAYYSAKRSDRRADSVMSVVFDRIAGLLGMILVGGIAGLFILREPEARRITLSIWLGMAGLAAVTAVYYSRRLRRWLGLAWLLSKMPLRAQLAKIDDAAVAYRDHRGAVAAAIGISIPVHLMLAGGTALAGFAFGMGAHLGLVPRVQLFGLLMTVIPVIFLSGAVPITPQGAGVWEFLGRLLLLGRLGITMNQIVAMLLMIRLYQLGYSLFGAIYLLRGDIHLHPEREVGEDATAAEARTG